jgi:S1-C subfamily serine protease
VCSCTTTGSSTPLNGIEGARLGVVNIHVSGQTEDYQMPWQSGRPSGGSGTGMLIEGRRILSNAHVVSDARFIQVQKDGDPKKYIAKVAFIAHDCDLAVLDVEDQVFFEGMQPVSFADTIPALNDEVYVVGYPMGGQRVSITRGVVSRIDFDTYAHSGLDQHLVMQVDAAINPGNSGGPIFYDGKVVAVAFQGLMQGDNIGYGIPVPVIDHFLKDISDGKYNGYPELGIDFVEGHNTGLRKAYKMDMEDAGIVVNYVDPFGAAKGRLQPGDVLLTIDGYNIEDDGSINLDGNPVVFAELMERRQWGESVSFRLLRNGSYTNIAVKLDNPQDPFMYRNVYDEKPEYYIMAGLVFAPVNRALLYTVQDSSAPNRNQLFYFSTFSKIDDLYTNREEFVVMMRRLPHAVNAYADPFLNGIVSEINGRRITKLADVKTAFAAPTNGFAVISFEGIEDKLFLEAEKAEEADAEILSAYGIMEKEYFKK